MRLLLDTHALVWWGEDSPRMSRRAKTAIDEGDCFVSAVNAMEIATKFRLGKLPNAQKLAVGFEEMVASAGFRSLQVSVAHARVAGGLNIPHKDPFDRLLIAQAMIDGMTLVSNEKLFDEFGLSRIW